MTDTTALPLLDRLAGLAAFLPVFQAPNFEFGRLAGGEELRPGVRSMPYYALGEEAARFVRAAYDLGWVLTNFDWPKWAMTSEAKRLLDDPKALTRASPELLARLLTVLVRQDRFVEGALGGAFKSGLLTAIVSRADVLAVETTG